MKKYTPQQYINILNKLPPEIADIVGSMETSDKIYKIGEKHQLHIDKIGILHDITMDVLRGILSVKDFNSELILELQINPSEVSTIIRDINDEIFKPVKELMMKVYGDGAPNRPDSTLKTPHEEESHENISKKEIMAEIENPTKSEVKKINVNEAKNNEVEEYHTELKGKSLPRSDLPDGKSTTGVVMPSQVKSVSSIKLENTTNPEKIEPVKKNTAPEDTNNKKIDPYREPLE